MFFQAYLELRELAADILAARTPPTLAQLALGQHQRAYRDLTGALAAVQDAEFDLIPAPGEWPLRTVIHHMAGAERGFFVQITWAVEQHRDGRYPAIPTPEGEGERRAAPVTVAGTLTEVMSRYAALHNRIIGELSALTDDDLSAPSVWWEEQELPVRFRIHRFDAHLREHTIQVDKTLAGIGHPPSETERLLRLLHRALGECEAALIGAADTTVSGREATERSLNNYASMLESRNR